MSQKTLGHILREVKFVDGVANAKDLEELFFDMDFVENEDYFREDTIELGFETEAERVVKELMEQNLEPYALIIACLELQLEDDYYTSNIIETIVLENSIIVSCAYMY